MDFYITELESGQTIALSMLPEEVDGQARGRFQTYDFISIGEVKIPSGKRLLEFKWSGRLPGAGRKDASYVKTQHWQEPNSIIKIMEDWRKNGSKLRLLITETWINHDVCLESFSPTATGAHGDYDYSISFLEAKDVVVYTVSELSVAAPANTDGDSRPASAAESATTYTVVSGDSLWKIAKKLLGDGTRYLEIYELNKDVIGSNPDLIYPGQVLTIPG